MATSMLGCGPPLRTVGAPPDPSFACRAIEPTDGEGPVDEIWVSWMSLNADDDGNVSSVAVIVRTPERRCHFAAGDVPERCSRPAPHGDRIDIRDCAHEDFGERVVIEIRRPEPTRLSVHRSIHPADRSATTPLREHELGAIDILAHARLRLVL
jgi:hypothetical protein